MKVKLGCNKKIVVRRERERERERKRDNFEIVMA
jgi:hypothetical protein